MLERRESLVAVGEWLGWEEGMDLWGLVGRVREGHQNHRILSRPQPRDTNST